MHFYSIASFFMSCKYFGGRGTTHFLFSFIVLPFTNGKLRRKAKSGSSRKTHEKIRFFVRILLFIWLPFILFWGEGVSHLLLLFEQALKLGKELEYSKYTVQETGYKLHFCSIALFFCPVSILGGGEQLISCSVL